MNTENRKDWYDKAERWEAEFVDKFGEQFNIILNPSKVKYKTAPDLYCLKSSLAADLKVLNIPFYTSQNVFGIHPQDCWTFNPSDLFEYSVKYSDNFIIFIWKTFNDSEEYGNAVRKEESVYYTTLFELKQIVISSNKIHHYIRRMNDTDGNSYGSHGIDLNKLTKIC